jgi:hypothetical protein
MELSNYQFEPHYDEENGWYCRKLVYMMPAIDLGIGKFDSEESCSDACRVLNEINECIAELYFISNIKLEVREVK